MRGLKKTEPAAELHKLCRRRPPAAQAADTLVQTAAALPQDETVQQGLAQARCALWQAQEAEARAAYPDCSLAHELQNPHFVRLLTDRRHPFTVKQAYEAVHLEALRQQIEREAAMRVFAALQRQADRPRESGTAPQAGLPVHRCAATRQQRAALARRAAAGECIVL